MTFSSGFSKTTQASGLKIKPGLRASWVIRKSKPHALGAVEGRFFKVGHRSQNNGHVCVLGEVWRDGNWKHVITELTKLFAGLSCFTENSLGSPMVMANFQRQ